MLHVRESSKEDMERLFQAAMDPNANPGTQGTVPFRMRNLPASFFTPPEPQKKTVHSRDGSTDSTGYTNTPPIPGPTINHLRAHSSPAQLQQTPLSTAPPPPQHVRQHSCDLVDEQPLPPGWEMAKTPQGQRYFLNHLLQQTTWVDPRKANFNASHTTQLTQHTPTQSSQHSPNVSMQNLQQSVQNIPLPGGWEQAQTPEGEIYYINHVERTTTWFDPRLPLNMQLLQMNQSQNAVNPGIQGQGQAAPQRLQQQQTALQKLQKEKELLRQRQEELNRQELALRNPAVPNHQQLPNQIRTEGQNIETSSEMTTATDPFLGQNHNNDLHSRQESADSGLGGMGSGTNFLSRTPEEFLGNINDMDTQDAGQRPSDFNSMDMGTMGDNEHSNMDSDDLVPSLQEDISNELLNDVETVLSSNKMDNMDNLLTWL